MSRCTLALRRRRLLVAWSASLAINLALISGLVLIDRPPEFWIIAPSQERLLSVSIYRPQAATSEEKRGSVTHRSSGPGPPEEPERSSSTNTSSVSSGPLASLLAGSDHSPSVPSGAANLPDRDNVAARTARALRMLSACSRSADEQDRTDCVAQMGAKRDEEIDVVPPGMRAEQAAYDARRAYVVSGAAASQLSGGRIGDHGVSASIHYECSLKFGESASGKVYCPGTDQAVAFAKRLVK